MKRQPIIWGIILLFLLSSITPIASYQPNIPPVADAGDPYHGSAGDYFMLNGSGSYDPDGEIVEYLWRIAEEESPTFVGEIYNKTFGQTWNFSAIWLVYLFVTDNEGLTDRDFTYIAIDKPFQPEKPSGETTIKPKLKYTYTTKTDDPDGDQLYYRWYWGDETYSDWVGPYDSGVNISTSNKWIEERDYYISVQAKDSEEHYSMYSDPIKIKVSFHKSDSQDISNNIIYVDDDGGADYTRIQDAIDNASDGDTIVVYNGYYPENVLIDKSITLIGEDRANTIIDGRNISYVINVTKDDNSISNFNLINSGEYLAGVNIKSNNNHVVNNIFVSNYDGLELLSSDYNIISDNIIKNSSISSIGLHYSDFNIISNNTILYDNYKAIYLSNSCNNTISDNIIIDTDLIGMNIRWDSEYNIICRNSVINTRTHGGMSISSKNNIIYHNNFIHSKSYQAQGSGNKWDNGYPSGGNYWDDYTGLDSYSGENQDIMGSDGIGDIPYTIENNKGTDYYPLMNPINFGDNLKPTIQIVKPLRAIYKDNTVLFPFFIPIIIGELTIEVDAFDGFGIKNVSFFIDDELVKSDGWYGYNYKWKSEGIGFHKVKVIVYDYSGFYEDESITVFKIN